MYVNEIIYKYVRSFFSTVPSIITIQIINSSNWSTPNRKFQKSRIYIYIYIEPGQPTFTVRKRSYIEEIGTLNLYKCSYKDYFLVHILSAYYSNSVTTVELSIGGTSKKAVVDRQTKKQQWFCTPLIKFDPRRSLK